MGRYDRGCLPILRIELNGRITPLRHETIIVLVFTILATFACGTAYAPDERVSQTHVRDESIISPIDKAQRPHAPSDRSMQPFTDEMTALAQASGTRSVDRDIEGRSAALPDELIAPGADEERSAEPVVRDYLTETIDPCTLWTVPETNPCDRYHPTYIDDGTTRSYGDELTMDEVFDEELFGNNRHGTVPQIVVRGTGLPDSSRCRGDVFAWHLHTDYWAETAQNDPRALERTRFVHCYIDIAVQEYIVGTGPGILTLEILRRLSHESGFEYWIEYLEPQIERAYAGNEILAFATHHPSVSIEGLSALVSPIWIDPDGRVFARGYGGDDELDDLVVEIKEADASRLERTQGRLGQGAQFPEIIRDVHDLRGFYQEAGALDHPFVTPQPPPSAPQTAVLPATRIPDLPTPVPAPPTPTALPEAVPEITNLHVMAYWKLKPSPSDGSTDVQAEIGWCAQDPRIIGFTVHRLDHETDDWITHGETKGWWTTALMTVSVGQTYTVAVEEFTERGSVDRAELTFTVPETVHLYALDEGELKHPCVAVSTPIPLE